MGLIGDAHNGLHREAAGIRLSWFALSVEDKPHEWKKGTIIPDFTEYTDQAWPDFGIDETQVRLEHRHCLLAVLDKLPHHLSAFVVRGMIQSVDEICDFVTINHGWSFGGGR
jgi:hypothetical protein